MGFTTKILHTAFAKKDAHGALRMPLYGNAAFEFDSAESIAGAFSGTKPAHTYSRSSNPSVDYFERQIMAVTNAVGVIGFSSGMAAISNTIFAIAEQGDEIISSHKLFGTTYAFFKDSLPRLGIKVKFVDFQNIAAIEQAITTKTRAIFFETITNPQIEIFDIEKIVELARKHAIISISDVTATPPYLFDSKAFSIDIAVLSSTKFISGGATAVGGLCIDNGLYDWKQNPHLETEGAKFGPFTLIRKLRLETYRNTGGCMSPHSASFFSLGLETLELRVNKACENAEKIALFLAEHPKVTKLRYNGIQSSEYYERSQQYFTKPGAIICFELESKEACFNFINKLSTIRRATNLHDNKSLIIHPASTIYCEFSQEIREEIDIHDTMIRFTVGIENYEDILQDIEQAFAAV